MRKEYPDITVNERLFVSGLLEGFDKAVANKDYVKAKETLFKVELIEESIFPVLKSIGLNPDTEFDSDF